MGVQNRDRRRLREQADADDTRTRFQHDRDRILYASAFRRLAGVTQVVGSGEGHVFHNRLTHSLRVAQVARRVAERLLTKQSDEASSVVNPDVAESAALAHDLGHPPFGHVAETELDELLRTAGLADGFEGNAQSFRIVTRLAMRRSRSRGLNLTRATLNAVLKYPWQREVPKSKPEDARSVTRDAARKNWRKFGAYNDDSDMFQWVRKYDNEDASPTTEASIMDWADDVTYAVHDLEDFYRAGLIPLDRLLTVDEEVDSFVTESLYRWRAEDGKRGFSDAFLEQRLRGVLNLIGTNVALREPFNGSGAQRRALRRAASSLIAKYVRAVHLAPRRNSEKVALVRNRASRAEVEMLKQLTWHYVIHRPSLASQQLGQRAVVRGLFDTYMAAMEAGVKSPARLDVLPVWAREVLQASGSSGNTAQAWARLSSDVVCAMSEQQALDLFARVSGTSLGSITDLI